MAVKAFGIALKLTIGGNNQFSHPSTYAFAIVVVVCILTQMNYFNKALSQFSTSLWAFSSICYLLRKLIILQCEPPILRHLHYSYSLRLVHLVSRLQHCRLCEHIITSQRFPCDIRRCLPPQPLARRPGWPSASKWQDRRWRSYRCDRKPSNTTQHAIPSESRAPQAEQRKRWIWHQRR